MSLGEKLLDLRKKAGLSQEDVAEKLGVSRQTVSKWESDQTVPELIKAKLLS
ncbi:MAG TPA: helix-turn-helix transcriptional regulator, partial [Clostridia bacterium]